MLVVSETFFSLQMHIKKTHVRHLDYARNRSILWKGVHKIAPSFQATGKAGLLCAAGVHGVLSLLANSCHFSQFRRHATLLPSIIYIAWILTVQ